MNLACVYLLTVRPVTEILNFMIYMKVMNSVHSKMKIKPTFSAHSCVSCDAKGSWDPSDHGNFRFFTL